MYTPEELVAFSMAVRNTGPGSSLEAEVRLQIETDVTEPTKRYHVMLRSRALIAKDCKIPEGLKVILCLKVLLVLLTNRLR